MHNYLEILPKQQDLTELNSKINFYLDEILRNQYYTESGPLLRRLEERLVHLFSVKNIIAVPNISVAWLLALEYSGLRDEEIFVTENLHPNLLSIFEVLSCRPIQIDLTSFDKEKYRPNELSNTSRQDRINLLLTNRYSGLEDLHLASCNRELNLRSCLVDSSDSFLSKYQGSCSSGNVKAEVFNLPCNNLVPGEYPSFIATNCDNMADYLRCMRGSGGVLKVVNTTLSANGRMSEGQAALGLAYLDLCNKECTKQQKAYDVYSKIISKVESVNVLSAQHTSSCEYHKFVVSFDNQEVEAQVLDQLRIKKISIGQMSFDGLRQHKHHGRIHFGLPTNISASEATQLALTIFRRL